MEQRITARIAVGLSTTWVALSVFCGGPALGLFVAGLLVVALTRRSETTPGVALLVGCVVQVGAIGAFWVLRPLIGSVPIVSGLFFSPLGTGGSFSALPFTSEAESLTRASGLMVLMAAPILILLKRIALGASAENIQKETLVTPLLAANITMLVFGIIKWRSPSTLLAATMSGDARNHFLIVQQTRATSTSSNLLSLGDLASPRFPHSIVAVLSSGNGTSGINNLADQWALAGFSILLLGILSVGCAALVQFALGKSEHELGIGGVSVIGLGCASASVIGYGLFPIFADGFFTLLVGLTLLTILCVFVVISPASRIFSCDMTLLALSSFLVLQSYPFLILVALSLFIYGSAPVIRRVLSEAIFGGLPVVFMALLAAGYSARLIYPKFADAAVLPGAVIARDVTVVLACGAIALTLFSLHRSRIAGAAAITAAATVASVLAIESVEGNDLPGLSYYATKIVLVGGACSVALLPAVLLSSHHAGSTRLLQRRSAVIALSLALATPHAMVGAAPSSPLLPIAVAKGWSTPSPRAVAVATAEWGPQPTAFFRYWTDGDVWLTAEDRLMNFWMPAFWSGFEGPYTGLWAWVYLEHVNEGTGVACTAIERGIEVLITRDVHLSGDLAIECPAIAPRARIVLNET